MNKEKYLRNKNILDSRQVDVLTLMIVDEIECSLDKDMDIDDKCKLYSIVENMYLKDESNMNIGTIVRYCLDKGLDYLEKKGTRELLVECTWYDR